MNINTNVPDICCDGLERVSDTARYLGVSKSFVYALINSGKIPSVKLGTSRRLPVRAVRDFARTNLVRYPERVG